MAESKSLLVQNLLARPKMHHQWEGDNFWFQQVKWPGPAFGNILLFHKSR